MSKNKIDDRAAVAYVRAAAKAGEKVSALPPRTEFDNKIPKRLLREFKDNFYYAVTDEFGMLGQDFAQKRFIFEAHFLPMLEKAYKEGSQNAMSHHHRRMAQEQDAHMAGFLSGLLDNIHKDVSEND